MDPYKSWQTIDKDSGASLRTYTGSTFGKNEYGTVHDSIYGHTLLDEYAMRLIFPV